ncbi:MAG: hypothetical protein OXJ52_09065 [Oligoflexia bacterium]|nr:hypothetical protein [Oligoflexia bacterium]
MKCPKCQFHSIIKKGKIKTRKRGKKIQRFQCKNCKTLFTKRNFLNEYREKRPDLNLKIKQLYVEGMTLRGIARYLKCDYKTALRKFKKLSEIAKRENQKAKLSNTEKLKAIQIGELSSYVQSKAQPAYISFAVSDKAHILSCKSGKSRDTALSEMLEDIASYVSDETIFYFDNSEKYLPFIDKHYPNADYVACLGRDASSYLKQIHFTGLLIKNRLSRMNGTAWSLTKKTKNLQLNLELFQFNFNQRKQQEKVIKLAQWIKEPFDSLQEHLEIKKAG